MMEWDGWFTLATVATCFGLLSFTRISPDIIMSAGLSMLLLFGIVLPEEALSGFSNQGMLTVAVLYVVASGLTETGAVASISQFLLGRPRSERNAQLKIMLPASFLSAFLNNTPVVAIFMPALSTWAQRHQISLSRLLIPLSYASIAGGVCTLIGTSTNLVVNGLLISEYGESGLGFFDLLWIGVPIVVSVVVYILVFGGRLLPDRKPALNHYEKPREFTVEMIVIKHGPLIGKSIEQAGLRQLPGLFLMEIDRGGRVIPVVEPVEILQENDRLVFVGIVESVVDLQQINGLSPVTKQLHKLGKPRSERSLIEAVVSDSCPLIGKTIREGRFRSKYNAVIIAIARNGERLHKKIGDIKLRAGDMLLLEGYPSFIDQQHNSRDFYLVSQVSGYHAPRYERAGLASLVVVLMVLSVSFGWFTMLEASLLAAGLMIVTRCTSGRVARRSPDWGVLVVIATSFGIGVALQKTGASSFVAVQMMELTGGYVWPTLAMTFLITAIFTALATNNVAAVLMFPIAASVADSMQVSIIPFAVTIMVAASASFATPIGYQTNLMIYNLGGYRFSDFLKIGLPLTIIVWLLTIILVPVIWKL